MPVNVLIAASIAGLPPLSRDGLVQLYAAKPELFGHPHEAVEFDNMPGRLHVNLEDEFDNCFVQDGKAYFLQANDPEFRTSTWLLQKFESGELIPLLRTPLSSSGKLKVVEIPSDVCWYLDCDDDGSEFVREKARIWA